MPNDPLGVGVWLFLGSWVLGLGHFHIIPSRAEIFSAYRPPFFSSFTLLPNDVPRFLLVKVVFIFPVALTWPSFNSNACVNAGVISST